MLSCSIKTGNKIHHSYPPSQKSQLSLIFNSFNEENFTLKDGIIITILFKQNCFREYSFLPLRVLQSMPEKKHFVSYVERFILCLFFLGNNYQSVIAKWP